MKYIFGRSRPQSPLGQLALVILLAVAAPPAKAGGVDFKQASNKNPALGNVIWINSILQQNNSRYFEGLSTLQRLVLLDIPPAAGGASPNSHTLTFNHEASKSGFHAYDFLTSWEQARAASIAYSGSDVFAQLNPDGENLTSGSTGDIIRQLREGPYRIAVSAPTNMGTVEGDDVQARANAYAVKFGERVIRLYGDAPILSAELKFTGYSGSSDQFAEYTLIWESASSNLLVEMAGHLAVGGAPGNPLGYGPGRGSSSINGGPYHFKLGTLDEASLGSQDNQIKGADIQVPPPVVQITPSVQSICIGSGTAEFTANVVADGAAPFSHAWTGPNGFTSNAPAISISAAGTYSVVVTGTNGLGSLAVSAVLTVNPLPVVSIKAPVITCSKSQVELIAESTATNLFYRWSGPGVLSSADVQTVTANQPGEYSVVVTDPNGCSMTATVTVLENKVQPDVFAEGGTLTCANSEIRLSASSATLGALFQWSGPGIVSDADTATPRVNKSGTYQVIITDPANGCSASATAIVTENKIKPEVRLTGGTLTCEHPQISLSAVSSLPDSLFTWAGPGIVSGANSANPVVNQPGDYVATVLNPVNGCSTVANVLVQENKVAPVINASGGVLTCAQKEIRLSATSSATGAKYLWSGPGIVAGADTPSPMVNKTGEYTVTVQDSGNGCSSTAVAIVTENLTPPLVTATGGTLTCASMETPLRAVCSAADANFRWSGPGIVSGAETASPMVNAPGIYLVTVTDGANGCAATASVTVNEDKQSPSVAVTGGTLTCANLEVVLNATSSVSGLTFIWRGLGIVDGAETPNPKVNKPGEYIVTALNPLNGCSTVTNVVVTENKAAPVVVTTGGTLTCAQTDLILNATSETPGAAFSWTGPGIVSGADTAYVTINVPGTYLVTVMDPVNGCSSVGAAMVIENKMAPSITAEGGVLTCAQRSLNLRATTSLPNALFKWTGPGIVSGANTASPLINKPGEYIVTVQDPVNGCSSTAVAMVAENLRAPVVNVTGATLTCAKTEMSLHAACATAGATFRWSGPGIVSGAETDSPIVNLAGAYSVTVTDPANGCATTASVTAIEDKQPPVVSATGGMLTCAEPQATLRAVSSSPTSTFLWTGPGMVSGADTATPSVNQPGTYSVMIIDERNGCSATATTVVTENKTAPEIEVTVAPRAACVFLLIDEDSIDNTEPGYFLPPNTGRGANGVVFTDRDVNDDRAAVGLRTPLRFFNDPANFGKRIIIRSGQVGDEGLFALKTVPNSWETAGPTTNGLANFLGDPCSAFPHNVGLGLGRGNDPEIYLDKIPKVTPLRASGLNNLVGRTVCALVYDSDISINYAPLNGNLQGANLGIVAFKVIEVKTALGFSSSTLPLLTIEIVNPCGDWDAPTLFADAPELRSSSEPMDITVPAAPKTAIAVGTLTLTCAKPESVLNASSQTAGATFSWTGPGIVSGAETSQVTVNAPGTYVVTVTDPANGCSSMATAVVLGNNTPPSVTAEGGTLTCAQQVLNLRASSSITNGSFMWTGPGIRAGADSASPAVSAPGIYTVVVTDPENGCAGSTTATVTQDTSTPAVTAQGAVLTCSQTQAVITASVTKPGMICVWSGPGIVSGADSGNCVVNAAGLYSIEVTDPATGCTTTKSVSVTKESPSVVTLACAASSGQVGVFYNSSLVASGGVPPYTFSIVGGSLPTGMTLTPTTGALTGVPMEPGSFGFTAQVLDSNGSCASSTTVNGQVTIIGNGGYRVTGGSNRGTNMFQAGCITTALPTHVSHGGQVGAAYSVATPFSPNSECISGEWQHNRHLKGNSIVGKFHASGNGNVNQFDSLLGACLPCPEDLGAVGVVGGVCNPGSRICGPEPRRAPGNKICFSGVGDYTFTTGNKTVKAVFRVDIEDRGEGGSQLPDRYRIRLWLLDPSCGRNPDPDSPEAMALRYAASADSDKIAVLATTEDLKVNIPPDIDDGGNMTQGNHQIHPETGAHCGESAHNAPSLKTTRGPGGTIIAMWPAVHSNYVLQTSSSMTSANWVNVTGAPVVLKNKCTVTNAISNGIQFFRLIKP